MARPTQAGERCRRLHAALLTALLSRIAAALPGAAAAPPNMIFILTDDADAMHGVRVRLPGCPGAGRAGAVGAPC